MKKFVLILVALVFTLSMNAQTVNGYEIEDIPAKYVQIVSTAKLFKLFQVTTYLDYGQISKLKEVNKGRILNSDGKNASFNGVMGVLNFLESKGYKYVNQYVVTTGNQNVYHTLLENTNYKQ